ncbi:hypothetical protein [Streptomyces sp. NPDC005302]|uniref:hypothetical protein n=1 Tax=Streptomyces sp. NPDC005302 TaxID=3154675 RepID=UPI0033B3FE6B
MAALVGLGAPELPTGYFYRVKEDRYAGVEVEVREQRNWGSRLVAGVWVDPTEFDDMAPAVVDACHRVCDAAAQTIETRAKYVSLRAFLGDHDPKGGK